jgi:general L-amino acid transport system permease protein
MIFKKFNIENKKARDLIPQAITVLALLSVIIYFATNAQINMGNRGISFGFGFLNQEASFDITFSMIEYDGSHSYGRAFLVGLLNTILVSAIGIFFATITGVVVGISRLSDNYLIAKVAEWYVEIFRNIPLILQIFFWYFAALRALPLPENGISFYDISFLTIKGWYVPKFIWTNFNIFLLSVKRTIRKTNTNNYYFFNNININTFYYIPFSWSISYF